jgi:GNAT superfamily N-acetyltransferase
MRVDARLYREVEPAEREELERLAVKVRSVLEDRLGSDLRWAEVNPDTDYVVRLWDDDRQLRARAWVTRQAIRIESGETPVAGVRGVMTDPDRRRRGYGRAVMEKAHELMRSFADCDLGLLFSSVMAVPFYEALGWRVVPGPVSCDQPGGPINYTEALPAAPVMALKLRPSAEPPSGPFEACGLPW